METEDQSTHHHHHHQLQAQELTIQSSGGGSTASSSRNWLGTVFKKINKSSSNEEQPAIIHLLGGSFVLDFNGSSGDGKKVQRDAGSKEHKKLSEAPSSNQYYSSSRNNVQNDISSSMNPFEANPTVENWNAYMALKAEERRFIHHVLNSEDIDERMTFATAALTLFSMVSYIGDVVSDLVATYNIFQDEQYLWASLSLAFTVVPIVVINIASLMWYCQNNLYKDSSSVWGWRLRILAHVLLLGMVCRNVDILLHGHRMNKESKNVSSQFLRGHYFLLYREQRRVTAFLTLIECFLQDVPQFSLQIYIWTIQNRTWTRLLWKNFHLTQYVSIAFSLSTMCYSVVSYHQTLRYTKRHVLPMSIPACIAQFAWRVGTTGSRLLAIMFAVTAYPYATLAIISFHWLLMILWHVTQENSNILITKFTRAWTKCLYNILMASIHIFCFLSVFANRPRYHLVLFYIIQFIEDFILIGLWYFQLFFELNHYHAWVYHLGTAIYVNAFLLGILSMILFYAILHPNMTNGNSYYQATSEDEEEFFEDPPLYTPVSKRESRKMNKNIKSHFIASTPKQLVDESQQCWSGTPSCSDSGLNDSHDFPLHDIDISSSSSSRRSSSDSNKSSLES